MGNLPEKVQRIDETIGAVSFAFDLFLCCYLALTFFLALYLAFLLLLSSTRMRPLVPTPDFHQPVLVRAAKDCGPITLPESVVISPFALAAGYALTMTGTKKNHSGMKMELAAGSQHMVRYNSIRELLLRESVDLI